MITEINTIIPDDDTNINSYSNYCASLAKDVEMPLNLIATVPPFRQSMSSDPFYQEVPMVPVRVIDEHHKKKVERVQHMVNSLQGRWKRIYKQVRYGFIEDQMIEIEQEHQPYLWTMKKAGRRSAFNRFLDSADISVIKHLEAPVLSVPSNKQYERPKRVVLLHNQYGDKLNIQAIKRLQQRLKFKLHLILDLSKSKDKLRDALSVELKAQEELKIEKVSVLPRENILQSLKKLVEKINPDWMAIQQFDRSPWDRLISDYSFNRLINSERRPSLIIA